MVPYRVVVAHHPFLARGQHQFQLDSGQLDEGAFLLRRLDRKAAIEVGDEELLQVAIGRLVVGDLIYPQLLGQAPLDGPERTLAAAAGLRGTGQDLANAQCV